MAIISSNNLGRIRKKSGPNVFRKWRNLDVMGVYTSSVRNPRTNAQQLQRTKFSAMSALAAAFSVATRIGFKNVTNGTKVPPRDHFMKVNFGEVTASTPGTATIDYTGLLIAAGSLPEVQFGTPTFTNPLEVAVPINDSASILPGTPDDLVYIFVYSPEAGAGILAAPKVRSDAEITADVPDYWVGQHVHVYGFGISPDGSLTSKSHYLGTGTIS